MDKWLTAEEARAQFGFSPVNLNLWAREGCIALNGKCLRVKGPHATPRLYWRGDLELIARVPRLENGTYTDARGVWLTATAVHRKYGFPVTHLTPWRKKICPLLGRKLQARRMIVCPGGRQVGLRRAWLYFQPDLDELAAARNGTGRARRDSAWLSAREAKEEFGFTARNLNRWAAHGHAALGRKGLRCRKELRGSGSLAGLKRVFAREDLELIRSAMQGKAEETPTVWVPIGRASKTFWVPTATLHYWRSGCVLFGRPIRAQRMPARMEDGRVREIWHFHRDDLETISKQRGVPEDRRREPAAAQGPQRTEQKPAKPAAQVNSGKPRGGRPISKETEKILEACYLEYMGTKTLSQALLALQKRFGDDGPQGEPDIRLYAKRYAKRKRLPINARA